MSEGAVIEQLRAAVAELPEAGIIGCQDEADRLRDHLARIGVSSACTFVESAAGWLAAGNEALKDALAFAGQVRAHVESWINRPALGTAPLSAGATSVQVVTKPTVVPPVDPAAKWASDPRPAPEVMADAVRSLPPRTDDQGPTQGVWIDPHERTARTERSGEFDQQAAAAVLAKLGIGPEGAALAVTAHVEIKVAAKMHESAETREVHLAINNADGPCGGPYSCDRIAPRVLQPGQRLTVYWPDGDTIRSATYRGREPK
ncbi:MULTISPECIES: DddA-like double-stranded DNA deaminase toxin [unclassified Crossiella]|uniref:DddA-like double-stranded DNA deaminase toxin n=1 Tax=unclassified Crossiella TaxID=2620835 RepID=UPI001FFECB6B|nr:MULTISPECIES: DddA-like double-stranded DNA deaminase toxin [unclassified Crossiella]MCK2243715.1 hypothetical protein [Crossiella sp. S99.2]MCK2257574.1 hypothetical protein [Crossiella sp. S99.1]